MRLFRSRIVPGLGLSAGGSAGVVAGFVSDGFFKGIGKLLRLRGCHVKFLCCGVQRVCERFLIKNGIQNNHLDNNNNNNKQDLLSAQNQGQPLSALQ